MSEAKRLYLVEYRAKMRKDSFVDVHRFQRVGGISARSVEKRIKEMRWWKMAVAPKLVGIWEASEVMS